MLYIRFYLVALGVSYIVMGNHVEFMDKECKRFVCN